MKKTIIITDNKELCDKLNNLKMFNQVVIHNVKPWSITKIMKSINKEKKCLDVERVGDKYILTKVNPLNFHAYHRKHRGFDHIFLNEKAAFHDKIGGVI